MQQKWYGGDRGLQLRMVLTMGMLILLYLFFIAAMIASGANAVVIMIIASIMLGAQYFFSDKLMLFSSGAKEVSEQEEPELHAMVDRLVQQADLPKPKVAIIDTDVPNAFATGRSPDAAAVAVTRGLMRLLDPAELEGVIAHELAHVKNRDVAVMTIASFFATLAQMVLRFGFWGGMGGGRRRDEGGGSVMIFFGASIIVWLVSFVLIRTLSRYREFAADRGAALLTGSPAALQSALLKIDGTMHRIPQKDLREVAGMNAFFIIPAEVRNGFMELFSTHPALDKRIAYLDKLAQEMESYR
jgi:heat shock protein HtpX